MKKFEELTMEELKALYNEKIEQEKLKQEEVEKEKPKRWRANYNDIYGFINDEGDIEGENETHSIVDDFRYKTGNYFKTEEEAEEHKKKLLLQQEYKDWCKFDCDWNNNEQKKYCVYYGYTSKNICFDFVYTHKRQGAIYAESVQCIQEFIDKIGEEDFKKYILEVEE